MLFEQLAGVVAEASEQVRQLVGIAGVNTKFKDSRVFCCFRDRHGEDESEGRETAHEGGDKTMGEPIHEN